MTREHRERPGWGGGSGASAGQGGDSEGLHGCVNQVNVYHLVVVHLLYLNPHQLLASESERGVVATLHACMALLQPLFKKSRAPDSSPLIPFPLQNSLAHSLEDALPGLTVVWPVGHDWQAVVAEAPPKLQAPTTHCWHVGPP